jgi:hypothetical protein
MSGIEINSQTKLISIYRLEIFPSPRAGIPAGWPSQSPFLYPDILIVNVFPQIRTRNFAKNFSHTDHYGSKQISMLEDRSSGSGFSKKSIE